MDGRPFRVPRLAPLAWLLVVALLASCVSTAGGNPGAASSPAAPAASGSQHGAARSQDGAAASPAPAATPVIPTTPASTPASALASPDPDDDLDTLDDAAIPGRSLAPSLLDGVELPVSPTPSPIPALPRPTQPYAMNLYASGDFVAQYTFEWCVGASIQMALNMIGDSNDRTRARQEKLWELAQSLSGSPFGGANARGWTLALNVVGAGPYDLVSEPDLDAALRRAAVALRETRRPVGLLMWRGRHAWVMSGFQSLGDPATVPNFEVTGVRVLDPLYPHGDDVWGPSPRPNALLDPATLGEQFVARLRGRVDYGIPPGYFLVLPRLELAEDRTI
jgi:hypothetical protein